jgi:deoxyribodipyrimidine photo-lyase
MRSSIPVERLRDANQAPVRPERDVVLYWMTAFRRTRSSWALQRAVEWARELGKPLLVLEALRIGYRWASDRIHRFVIEGMADNAAAFAKAGIAYYPYVEPEPDAGKGLLAELAERACVVVADDYPGFFLPRMVRSAAKQVGVRMELVDANGLLPLRIAGRAYGSARGFRLLLQKELRRHLAFPKPDPLARLALPRARIPRSISARWPAASAQLLGGGSLARLDIDHSVPPVRATPGGSSEARARLGRFVETKLPRYASEHNHPDSDITSGLSPYLHFGQISAHEALQAIADREGWSPARLPERSRGGSRGWWGMSEESESFLDQLVTWRELSYNFCAYREDADRYDSLPTWARQTLDAHAADRRPAELSLEQLEQARSPDPLWNAAQRQLLREGRIHNYLRILWGKRVLEWTATPQRALEVLLQLNDKHALDGRDPNSYSGILWIYGRYDRPWGPERPIFGKVRYVSSASTARKAHVRGYLEKYAGT